MSLSLPAASPRLALTLAFGLVPAAGGAAPAPLDLCATKPVFTEDFDRPSIAARTLGMARWTAHTPWNGDFGDAVFADPGPGGPFAVADGQLRITASRRPDGRWQSGLIAAADPSGAGDGAQYGYFEARMRFPPGPGTWPAFWLATLRPAGTIGPAVELDVVEYYGHATDSFQQAVHVWYPEAEKDRSRHALHKSRVPAGSLVADFHDYGVRVTPDTVTFFLDRQPLWEQPTPPELKGPLFPLVNLALGSGFPIDRTPDPSTLLVDYVHIVVPLPAGQGAPCPAAKP